MTGAPHDAAVAVIGMAGRFPGAATVDELWVNLKAGIGALRPLGRDQLLAAGVAPALIDDPDYVPVTGIVDGIDQFDARFFDYSVREAQLIDPQQRLFLECAWHALEHAGCDPARHGGAIGVFASASMATYLLGLAADPVLREQIGMVDLFLHNAPDYLATRVSYKAGLVGPSFTVQTGCSSSLVAIHLACQSLLAGECDVALAGGATVRAVQRIGYRYLPGGPLSPEGQCRPFDARSSGTVPGEVVAAVALMRLDTALRGRHRIHAVIAGSAVNNDGNRKVGYTAPSVEGQRHAIAEALDVAGVAARAIGLVEAHGTATRLGDPLEVAALTRAFRATTADHEYCALGSIKSSIGHADAAAGVAGFIKAVLAIEHGVIPATLGFTAPNPELDLAHSPFFVNREAIAWPAAHGVRHAGVSAFGVGGTNAHIVLAQAPEVRRTQVAMAGAEVVVVSARSEAALDRMTTGLLDRLDQLDAGPAAGAAFADLAFTSQCGRKAFEFRAAVVAGGPRDAAAAIRTRHPLAVRRGTQRAREVAFLFPGGGAQYPGMGRGHYESEPVFRAAIDRCCELVAPQVGLDLRTLMYPAPADVEHAGQRLREARYAVPAIWMTDYALAELLGSWGVTPTCLLGHSLGEYVAAALSGVLSVADSLRLATFRAVVCERATHGASLSVSLGEHELRPLLPPGAEIAVSHTPASCVASGAEHAIAALERELGRRAVSCIRLPIRGAVHSSFVEPAMDEVTRFAREIRHGAPRIPYYSNLTGRLIEPADATPDYWARHLRHTVRFADNVRELLGRRGLVAIEVGPGTGLASAVAAQHGGGDAVVVSAMRQPRDPRSDREVLLSAVAGAWSHGVVVDWRAAARERDVRIADFPLYPFEPDRHWIETAAAFDCAPGVVGSGPAAEVAPVAPRRADPEVALPPGLAGDDLARVAAQAWHEHLGVTVLAEDSNFFALGGTSLVAMRVVTKLQRRLRPARRLVPEDVLRAPAFGAFVEHVRAIRGAAPGAGSADAAPASSLVPLRAGTSPELPPLFLVHPAGGHVLHYRQLVEALDPRVAVYGLVAPGLGDGRAPLDRIEALAEHHLASLRAAGHTARPVLLAGSSSGGCVAFEIAQRMRAAGERVALLAMLDTPAPDDLPRFDDHADFVQYLFGDVWNIAVPASELRALPEADRIGHALRVLTAAGVDHGFDAETAAQLVAVFTASGDAMRAYRPEPYGAAAVYFRARERRPRDPVEPDRGWLRYLGDRLWLEIVPGNHLTMHEPPHVAELAARLNRYVIDR
jgi:acyl transferase domain-containing protein/thioesterase domain-containing protein